MKTCLTFFDLTPIHHLSITACTYCFTTQKIQKKLNCIHSGNKIKALPEPHLKIYKLIRHYFLFTHVARAYVHIHVFLRLKTFFF